jgi:aspartyl-tRNA(Asn)/glutamyl-tRNA(Gln) amidotransferase subunit A
MAAEPYLPPAPRAPSRIRLGVVTNYVTDDVDEHVGRTVEAALRRLSAAGAVLQDVEIPPLAELPQVNAAGGLVAAEAYAWHRRLLERDAGRYDPRVGQRILRGAAISAADYIDLLAHRRRLIDAAAAVTAAFDAVVMPTVPIVAPRIAELAADADYFRLNALSLRNCTVGNFLDRCAVTLPVQPPGALPVGLMLMGEHGADRALLDVAAGVEAVLSA